MADEITHYHRTIVTNGDYTFDSGQVNLEIDQATKGVYSTVISLTTSDTAVSVSNITNKGIAEFKNLDATNYIDYGPTSGGALVAFGRLKAGESFTMRLSPAVSLRMQANTATCLVQVTIHEA
jgi:hypothetical protein